MFTNTEFTGNTVEPDVVGYGDIHRAFVMHFHQQMLFNVGSVGNPLDMPQASYAILEGAYASQRADTFAVHVIRVPYDIERAIHQAAEEAHARVGRLCQGITHGAASRECGWEAGFLMSCLFICSSCQ